MSGRTGIIVGLAAVAIAAGTLSAPAWEQLDLGTGQSGQPTYAPEAPLRFKDLPGVQMNSGQQTADGSCTESRFYSHVRPGLSDSGTVTECNFGRFSFKSYRSGGAGGNSAYNPFPVPGPLQQAGPPPGSGGAVPPRRW